jgi:hypothetical protein
VRCDETASLFVTNTWCEVFANFQAIAVEGRSSLRNWLFGLPGRLLCKRSPGCEREWRACSRLCSLPVRPSSLCPEPSIPIKQPCTVHTFLPKGLRNHYQGLHRTFSEISTKHYARSLSLSGPSRTRIRPDTRLQIKGRETSACSPSYVKFSTFVHWLTRFASTIIQRCIAPH